MADKIHNLAVLGQRVPHADGGWGPAVRSLQPIDGGGVHFQVKVQCLSQRMDGPARISLCAAT
jgi:hypothetical protein